jgi:EAL domain-containing protein (putative c-di-GMP-specific phosphodiesterase class I)
MLSSLIYRSHIQQNIDQEMITQLLVDANQKNQQLEISGLLFYDTPFFFQVIEGPEKTVQVLYEKILADIRHSNVVLLAHENIKTRQYPNLGMHFLDIEKIKSMDLTLGEYRKENNLRPLDNNFDSKLEKFICQFIEKKYNQDLHKSVANIIKPFSYPTLEVDTGFRVASPNGHSFAFQSVIDYNKRKTVFLEALARGPQGANGNEYLANMSQFELEQFEMHSTEDAISLAAQLGIHKLSVNFSPDTVFKSVDIVDKLENILRKYGLRNIQLIVEITESDFIGNHPLAQTIISRLRASGIALAIDDFGAGYAGLSLLAQFQPDILKIDSSLIQSISSSGPKQSIVSAIHDCAENLAISVVAEGVEDENDFQFLSGLGITHFQGYLFSQPTINSYTRHNW